MVYETEFIPHRPNGCPVATDRALGTSAETGRTTAQLRTPRNNQRDSLHNSQRLHMAGVAARSAAVSDRVPLLPSVAEGWNVGSHSQQASRAGSNCRGENSQTIGGSPRQPKREDDRTRRAARLRRRKKKWSAASGMSWLTRLVCSGRWLLLRPACRIVMAENSP